MGIAHAALAAFQLAKKSSKDFFDKLKKHPERLSFGMLFFVICLTV